MGVETSTTATLDITMYLCRRMNYLSCFDDEWS